MSLISLNPRDFSDPMAGVISAAELEKIKHPPIPWVIPNILPAEGVSRPDISLHIKGQGGKVEREPED